LSGCLLDPALIEEEQIECKSDGMDTAKWIDEVREVGVSSYYL
jgi:hypothetical protein